MTSDVQSVIKDDESPDDSSSLSSFMQKGLLVDRQVIEAMYDVSMH